MGALSGKAELLLARFPGPVVLYPSRKKWLTLLMVCGLFAAGGLAMVRGGIVEGWFLLVFFSALLIVGLGMLLPGASALTLDEHGFAVTKFFRRDRARWQDVSRFAVFEMQRGWAARWLASETLVVYDDAAAGRGFFALLNKSLADHNAYLPDTYGLQGGELTWLMTQWRERARRNLTAPRT